MLVILPPLKTVGLASSDYCLKSANRLLVAVNFLGPYDEFVTSGSDDGNFFIWDKATAAIRGIYEGDSSVVNVVEGHPHLPLVAVSGIDTTVKVFRSPMR